MQKHSAVLCFRTPGCPKHCSLRCLRTLRCPGKDGYVNRNWWNACRSSLFCLYLRTKFAAEQDAAYSASIQNVFKLNTPWIQDSRFKVEGKAFPTILNLESKPLFKLFKLYSTLNKGLDPRFKIQNASQKFARNLES